MTWLGKGKHELRMEGRNPREVPGCSWALEGRYGVIMRAATCRNHSCLTTHVELPGIISQVPT